MPMPTVTCRLGGCEFTAPNPGALTKHRKAEHPVEYAARLEERRAARALVNSVQPEAEAPVDPDEDEPADGDDYTSPYLALADDDLEDALLDNVKSHVAEAIYQGRASPAIVGRVLRYCLDRFVGGEAG